MVGQRLDREQLWRAVGELPSCEVEFYSDAFLMAELHKSLECGQPLFQNRLVDERIEGGALM